MNTYIIETERLRLREFDHSDSDLIFELLNSPGWLKYIGNRSIADIEDAANYIEAKLQKGYRDSGFGFYLVELKATGEKTGMCGIVKREGLDDIDLGFALLPKFENKGYAFESSMAVIQYAKNVLNIKKLAAITLPSNIASIRVLEKIGMKFEKRIYIPGDPEELLLYSMQLSNL